MGSWSEGDDRPDRGFPVEGEAALPPIPVVERARMYRVPGGPPAKVVEPVACDYLIQGWVQAGRIDDR